MSDSTSESTITKSRKRAKSKLSKLARYGTLKSSTKGTRGTLGDLGFDSIADEEEIEQIKISTKPNKRTSSKMKKNLSQKFSMGKSDSSNRKRRSHTTSKKKRISIDLASVDKILESDDETTGSEVVTREKEKPKYNIDVKNSRDDWWLLESGDRPESKAIVKDSIATKKFIEPLMPTTYEKSIEDKINKWNFNYQDYENNLGEYIAEYGETLFDFPTNTVSLTFLEHDSTKPRIPSSIIELDSDPFSLLRSVISYYSDDYLITVNQKGLYSTSFSQYERFEEFKQSKIKKKKAKHSTKYDIWHYGTVKLIPELISSLVDDEEYDKAYDSEFNFSTIFHEINHNFTAEPLLAKDIGSPLTAQNYFQFLINIQSLEFQIGSMEPLYLTFSLYDIVSGKKLSEDLHIDLNGNDEYLQTLVDEYQMNPEKSESLTQSKHAVFSICDPGPGVYLVVRVSRVFGCDFENTNDLYIKENPNMEKSVQNILGGLSKFRQYRQAMGWGAISLFNQDGDFVLGSEHITIDLHKVTKVLLDDQIVDILKENTDTKNMGKPLNGRVTISADVYDEDMYYFSKLYSSSLRKIPTEKHEEATKISDYVKKLKNFGMDKELYPKVEFVNNIYIYPNTLNLNNVTKIGKAKNILMKMYLLADVSEDFEGSALKLIYGKTNTTNMVKEYQFPVQYNSKKIAFCDEVKVELPSVLTESHHLLFVFYNLNEKSMKISKKKSVELVSLIGYSYIRLFDEKNRGYNSLLSNGSHELPFVYDIKGGEYLTKTDFKYSSCLHITTRADSTIYSADSSLHGILRMDSSKNLENVLELVVNIDGLQLLQNFPILLNRLLYLSCIADLMQIGNIFQAILYVIHMVNQTSGWKASESEPDNPLLISFINYHYQYIETKNPLHESIISAWTNVTNGLCSPTLLNAIRMNAVEIKELTCNGFSNFFFALIIMSMLKKVEQIPDTPRNQIFSPGYAGLLRIFVQTSVQRYVGSSLQPPHNFNKSIAFWFSEMLYFYDRGVIFNLIHTYLTSLNTNDVTLSLKLKLDFIEILSDHEFYTPLLCPNSLDIYSPKSMLKQIWKHHFLPVHLIEIIREVYTHRTAVSDEMSIRSITILNNVIWNHIIDERYNSSFDLHLIAACYLPILSVAIENRFKFKSMEESETLLWIIPLMWIFRYSRESLRQYWLKESPTNLCKFIDLISTSLLQVSESPIFGPILHQTLDIFEDLIIDREIFIWENSSFAQNVFKFYLDLIQLNKVEVQSSLLKSFRVTIVRQSGPLFRGPNALEYAKRIISLLTTISVNGNDVKQTKEAATLIYQTFLTSMEEIGHIATLKICLTETLFEVCDLPNAGRLIYILGSIFWHMRENGGILQECTDMPIFFCKLARLQSMNYQVETVADPEVKIELLYQLSKDCFKSTHLRLALLERAIALHLKAENFVEVAQFKLIIAAILSDYLNIHGKYGSIYPVYKTGGFDLVGPNLTNELPIPDDEENIPSSFIESTFEELMKDAAEAFLKANLYELAVEIHYMLMNLFIVTKQFDKLNQRSTEAVDYSKQALSANDSSSRIFSKYYRVAFYGSAFGELDQAEFIYKELPMIRLADFAQRLKDQFSNMYETDIELLPNKPREDLELVPNKTYVQVVSVESVPHDRVRYRDGNAVIDHVFGLNQFAVEIPFFPDGKFTEDVDKQWKIRRTYVTENSFPSPVKRLRIIDEHNTTKGPLECAIDLIGERIRLIEQQLEIMPPNGKTLQIVLQGSIMIQVNAGPLAIARYFLDRSEEFEPELISALRKNLDKFARQVLIGLRLNTTIIDDTTRPHHEAMIEAYNDFCQALNLFGINCLSWA